MKTAHLPGRVSASPVRFILAVCFGIAMVAGTAQRSAAIAVDSELILLVDISQTGLNNPRFDTLMDSYAAAMTSSQVLDSIESGAAGSIAVSLIFYGGAFTQTTGIPWMQIGNAAQAQQFANLIQNIARPFSVTSSSISAALDYATTRFGTETGGASNGFESAVQVIEVAASTLPLLPNANGDRDARNDALADGVDIINSVALGNRASSIQSYYASNVVGGEAGGVQGSSSSATVNNALDDYFANHLGNTVEGGAVASNNAVPEPSSVLSTMAGAALLLLRRRRRDGSHSFLRA